MHGTFKPNIDKFLGEGMMLDTVLNKYLHIDFDFSVNSIDRKDLLQNKVLILKNLF